MLQVVQARMWDFMFCFLVLFLKTNIQKSFQIVHKTIYKWIGVLSPLFPKVMFYFLIDETCIFYKMWLQGDDALCLTS